MSLAINATTPHRDWITSVPQQSADLGAASLNAMPPFLLDLLKNTLPGGKLPVVQPTRIGLVVHVIMAKPSASEPVTIWASMENSAISSGKMMTDKPDQKGWFQDQVTVEMWLEDLNGQKRTDLLRISDGPNTVNGTGSTSSSVSFSFSSSVNAGFFGPVPTGGASVGTSVSESHSFSTNLEDFRVVNNSDQYTAVHHYLMSKSANGPAYNKPTDLAPNGNDIGFTQAFQGIQLYTPPDLATANLPLASQCVWQANHHNMIKVGVNLKIRVTQHVVMVDGTNNFFSVASHSSAQTATYGHAEPIPLMMLVDTEAGDTF